MVAGLATVVAVGLVLALVMVALLWLFQRRLIYLPTVEEVPAAASVLPGAEDVRFRTADGLTLNAWFVPEAGGTRRATVVMFNGNGGNRADRAPLAAELSRAGLAVLLVDYRGYGDNPGSPSEPGLLADARAARAYLDRREDVDPERIVYLGESLGAAVALQLAVEQPPAALVLRSPFTSLAEVGQLHYPLLPVRALLNDRFDSIRHVRRLQTPVLVVAGERDGIVPPGQSRRIAQAAPNLEGFVLVEGADHNDPALFTGEQLITAVTGFVHETVAAPGPPDPPAAGG